MNRQKRGTVLIITLGILTIMAIMGSSFAVLMRTEYEATQNYMLASRAKLIAYDGVVAAGKNLQDMLTYSYYSSLYNEDENSDMPEYLKLWCYGVDKTDGEYETNEVTGEYESIGSGDLLDSFAPVSLPYPYIDSMEKKAYIDFNGDEEYKEEDGDKILEEPDPESSNRIFYDEVDERPLFSGFPADGRFLGNVDVVAGQQFIGGNRFKLKILETNSQLSMNYLSHTLYDFLVNADTKTRRCDGSQFKYMLYFLGQGIQKMLAERIREETKMEPQNPFNKEVVDALWELKSSFGDSYEVQQFSAKTQIRAIVEDTLIGNPGYWKYVRDFITISAWPGYNSVYGKFNQNTVVPNITTADAYKTKLGEYHTNNPVEDSTLGRMTAIDVIPRVQPPVDCNTATLPVLYATVANVSGDARFWYFSPNISGGDNPDSSPGNKESFFAGDAWDPDDLGYTSYILADELARARRIMASNQKSLATSGTPGASDSDNYYYKAYNQISESEKEVKQFDQFDFLYGEANGEKLFSRNFQILQFLNISPFRAVWEANEMNDSDFAYNFARVIQEMRPFKGWADFDQRVIQEIIIENKGEGKIEGGRSVQICERFQGFWHPWNKSGVAADPDCDINQDYLEEWYYEAVADLVRANFNPTPKITKWNPDATYYQKIDRSDLVYWTVPFIFNNPGIFEVTSVGEIVGQVFDAEKQDYVPKPVIQKQYQAIIKVADIVRHHSQKDFATGFPARLGAFENDLEDYSVVRLNANEADGNDSERYSNLTTYPQPINEDIKYSHIENHKRIDRGSIPPNQAPHQWERTYYTGNVSYSGDYNSIERLYGTKTPSTSVPVGYLTVRPQDTGPFDYEMRIDANGNYMGTPNNIQNTPYTPMGGSNGHAALDIAKNNDPGREDGEWLNFWMPFNETYDTISKAQGAGVYGNMENGGESFQSARIGSEDNRGRSSANDITSSRGLVWNASGYTFRYYDFDTSDEFPAYLEYPAGVGFVDGAESDLVQRSNVINSKDIIEIMPHEDLQQEVTDMDYDQSDEKALEGGSEGIHRSQQWLRQKQTNFPYYKGTVEFWFKSDIDQWDMTTVQYEDDADQDTFYGGFLSANVLVQADPDCGIQGCQTYILREMKNVFRVTRVYFVDALKADLEGVNPTLDHWVQDDEENEAGYGEGHAMSTYIYKRSDTVPDTKGLNDQDNDDFEDLDTEDLGFIFARFDSWFDLMDVKDVFKWRPHEWYHLAFSFRSDREAGFHPEAAINFFINGVYVDANLTDNYPTTKMSNTDRSLWNTGTRLIGTKFTHGGRKDVDIPQKLGSIINEIIEENDHGARLVIGAIKRNQAYKDQLDDWSNDPWESGDTEVIHKEMFYFANGPFVAPCNGTMDAVRITGKYLDAGDTDFDTGDRIQAFARYNTTPGESAPELLGSYENGFRNTWGRDVRIANITWNEYRPKWDSAASTEVLYDDSSRCELSFYSYDELEEKGLENEKPDAFRSYGYDGAKSSRYKEPFKAEEDIYGIDKMGVAFPKNPLAVIGEDIERFTIPEKGYFIYEVNFYAGYLYAANSAAVFDELTVTILTPVEIFSFEEITE